MPGVGAITSNGMLQLNKKLVEALDVSEPVIERFIAKEQQELIHWERLYHTHHLTQEVRLLTILLVDDGMATGATMQVAIARLRQEDPARIIVAVPVASVSACKKLAIQVDALACLSIPERFLGIGCWYHNFPAVTEEENCTLPQQTELAAILG